MTREDLIYRYDKKAAARAVDFIEKFTTHTKGELTGQPLILEPWQRDQIIRPLFGWLRRKDSLRKHRTAYIEIPKKNGKSSLAAAMALKLLFSDNEPGAEIYSAAADKEQAKIVFSTAQTMVEQNEHLSQRARVYRNSIAVEKTGSFYKALSSDAFTKHGINPHGIVFDELHAQPDRELWEVLTTGVAARRQPLVIAITTAGYDKHSICWEIHDYAEKVLAGIVEDPTFLALIYAADPEADPFLKATIKAANPGYGTIVKEDYLLQQVKVASERPAYENTWRRLHLNQWTTQATKWISDEVWMKGDQGEIDLEPLKGADCFAALDLGSTQDTTALVLLFPMEDETFTVLPWFFIPELSAKERVKKDRVNYDLWIRQGHIIETPGNVTDYNFVKAKILALAIEYNIINLGFDRYYATQLILQLQDELGEDVLYPYGQGFIDMSAPTKEIERLTAQGRLIHGGHPVLRWQCSNVMIKQDPAGNYKIDKGKSTEKVDAMVSLAMALGVYIKAAAAGSSPYDTEGILMI